MSFRASRFCVAVSNMPARFLFFGGALGFSGCMRAYLTFLAWHTAFHGSVLSLFGYRDVGSSVCFSAFLHPLDGRWLAGNDGLFGFLPIYVSSFRGRGSFYRMAWH